MGGFGSGRQGGKPTMGRMRSYELSTKSLGKYFREGRPTFQMTFRSDLDAVTIIGMVDIAKADPVMVLSHSARCEPTKQDPYKIPLVRTHPHLGGVRWWFVCPRTERHVAKLYLPIGGQRFLSRQAYGLVHNTRQMSTKDRSSHRLVQIAAKLGNAQHHFLEPPPKPLRMRWNTYNRLVAQWCEARGSFWNDLDKRLYDRRGAFIRKTLWDTVPRFDESFYTSLAKMVGEEPMRSSDASMFGTLRTLGIEKGKEFKPDEPTRAYIQSLKAW